MELMDGIIQKNDLGVEQQSTDKAQALKLTDG
jgi:hypothetical protein